jgi:hypothetical protein
MPEIGAGNLFPPPPPGRRRRGRPIERPRFENLCFRVSARSRNSVFQTGVYMPSTSLELGYGTVPLS